MTRSAAFSAVWPTVMVANGTLENVHLSRPCSKLSNTMKGT